MATEGPEQSPAEFGKALGSMLAGQSRNRLEELLVRNVPRTILIEQDTSRIEGVSHLLALDQLTEARIRSICDSGKACAGDVLRNVHFDLPNPSEIEPLLATLIESAGAVLGLGPNGTKILRSNVFLVYGSRLVLTYRHNMKGDPDEDMEFTFVQGLTGFCYVTRTANICDLTSVREHAIEAGPMFNMPADLQTKVKEDRTWLMSTPILDPLALTPGDMQVPGVDSIGIDHVSAFPRRLDGPVLGVLNLDAALDYSASVIEPKCYLQKRNPRIRAILALVESVALDIGTVLSQYYPMRRPQ